jgi:hypothetical protein
MAIKIQINNLEALERLIGGDSDLELELRNSIVQAFANKHLKAVANATIMQTGVDLSRNHANAVAKEVEATFTEQVKGSYIGARRQLKASILKQIESTVKSETQDAIREIVREEIQKSGVLPNLETLIKRQADRIANEWASEEIERRIDRAATLKIEALLKSK